LPEALEAEERKRILDALRSHNWNRTKAAHALGSNRTTLIGKMKRLGILPPEAEAPRTTDRVAERAPDESREEPGGESPMPEMDLD